MTTSTGRDRGQVLVIVAVGIVIFLGFAALVVDVGMAYATQRHERNLTDSSSLAGAQELQQPTSRSVTAADRSDARRTAMTNLMNELAPGDPLPACGYNADFTDCAVPSTDYVVSMRTPSTLCVTCDAERSLLVSLEKQDVGTFFAGLFGQNEWDIRQTSVAGLVFEGKFAVITLRGPRAGNVNQNDPDISVGGGSLLEVKNGDIGSNTNMVISGSGSAVTLEPGFKAFHFDKPQAWVGNPAAKPIPNPVPDPNYMIPVPPSGTPIFDNEAAATDTVANCAVEIAKIQSVGTYESIGGLPLSDPTNLTCFKPGIYNFEFGTGAGGGGGPAGACNQNPETCVMEPGVYWLEEGMDIGGFVIGGYEAGQPGVALVFNECDTDPRCKFKGNNAKMISFNAGSRFGVSVPGLGQEATAAMLGGTVPVQTTGLTPEIPLTIVVKKDPVCTVGVTEPSNTCSTENNTLNIAGGGKLYLAGVQYAPTDNVQISGGSAGFGYAGQIIAWTVKYDGGTHIRQFFPNPQGNGILRLDEACSGAGTNSMSNSACHP